MNNENTTMKIKPVKGRAMLHWEGKHTIDRVGYYPPQLQEKCGIENPPEPTYDNFESGPNLVFQGDNKEILSTLLVNGFREQIDLIYIDPPFASGADYIRKVALRGKEKKLEAEDHSVSEQIQYTDIWKNDAYLQFMFERLTLMRQLLSKKGSMYLHCDYRKAHHLRLLLDEVFGEDNFVNEIIWFYRRWSAASKGFQNMHHTILFYSKEQDPIFNTQYVETSETRSKMKRGYNTNTYVSDGVRKKQIIVENKEVFYKAVSEGKVDLDEYDNIVYREQEGTLPFDVFEIPYIFDVFEIPFLNPRSNERVEYPTQKPEALLERIVKTSSNDDSIILDCFAGSGTTAVVAEKLGRRWIASDMNKGAVQTTMKRIQTCIDNPRGIAHYRINNYDASTHLERRNIVIKKCGVQINRQDQFFDGTVDGTLVKIVDLTKPFTQLDFQQIKDELDIRANETRKITVFCYGSESNLRNAIDEWNSPPCVNEIIVREIGSEGITTFEPAQAKVKFERSEQIVTITIENYISPTICDRLDIDNTLFDEHIEDFRAQIDYVLIDNDYSEECFKIEIRDIPENKEDFVKATYTVEIPRPNARIALKIVDMLGEETLKVG